MCCNTIPRWMMLSIAAVGLALGIGQLAIAYADTADKADEADEAKQDAPQTPAVLNFTVKDIAGQDVFLGQYHGQVVLIVNTASKCGLTPQYKQLQQLHEDHADSGLAILGFPANNFRKQEPGTNEEIAAFCEENYGVEFDMFAKVSVKGDDITPLYAFLTSKETNPDFAGEIRWNFDKFLVSREGKVVARFSPRDKPDSKQVLAAIKAELAKPVPAGLAKKQSADDAE